MKAYQAYAAGGFAVTRETPQKAARAFFERFPGKRKCNITEGTVDGECFSVRYGRKSAGEWPASWRDITKKQVALLPDTAAAA